MRFILLRNKENFENVVGATGEKFFAVPQQNRRGPFGLRKKSLLASSKRLPVVPLRAVRFSSRINDFFQQRNALELANSA